MPFVRYLWQTDQRPMSQSSYRELMHIRIHIFLFKCPYHTGPKSLHRRSETRTSSWRKRPWGESLSGRWIWWVCGRVWWCPWSTPSIWQGSSLRPGHLVLPSGIGRTAGSSCQTLSVFSVHPGFCRTRNEGKLWCTERKISSINKSIWLDQKINRF